MQKMVVGQSDLVGDQHPTSQCSLNTPKHAIIQPNQSYFRNQKQISLTIAQYEFQIVKIILRGSL